MAHTRLDHPEKSADLEKIKLMRQVSNPFQLDAAESLWKSKTPQLMNLFDPPINTFLFENLK